MSTNEADPADIAEQTQDVVPGEIDDTPPSDAEADEGDLVEQARTVPDEPDDEA